MPPERIAQHPAGLRGSRSDSLLLHARLPGGSNGQSSGVELHDCLFSSFPLLPRRGDILVLNNTKVEPVRFFAVHQRSGREIELLLVKELDAGAGERGIFEGRWEALARPLKKVKAGDRLQLSERLTALAEGRTEDGSRLIVTLSAKGAPLAEVIDRDGGMPIPPYIRGGRTEDFDRSLYQTTLAEMSGSVAAPTAGLHFTPEILAKLKENGVEHYTLTHHVGPGSFLPIKEDLASHVMSAEHYRIPRATREAILRAKQDGGRVLTVGTTCVRALESAALSEGGTLYPEDPGWRSTELFIYPGFEFRIVDCLLTNFHQPASTHLQLVSAFFGEQNIAAIYRHALEDKRYRFLSYGDAMFLERGEGRLEEALPEGRF